MLLIFSFFLLLLLWVSCFRHSEVLLKSKKPLLQLNLLGSNAPTTLCLICHRKVYIGLAKLLLGALQIRPCRIIPDVTPLLPRVNGEPHVSRCGILLKGVQDFIPQTCLLENQYLSKMLLRLCEVLELARADGNDAIPVKSLLLLLSE